MDDSTYRIAELIVRLVVAVVVVYLVPTISRALKNNQTYKIIAESVRAAQQLHWKEDGTVRKSYATAMARELLAKAGIEITDDQLSSLIEAAVNELRIAEGTLYKDKDKK